VEKLNAILLSHRDELINTRDRLAGRLKDAVEEREQLEAAIAAYHDLKQRTADAHSAIQFMLFEDGRSSALQRDKDTVHNLHSRLVRDVIPEQERMLKRAWEQEEQIRANYERFKDLVDGMPEAETN
jgi:hypothetical protein